MKAHICKIHYCVPLTAQQWQSLNTLDAHGDSRWDEVNAKLTKAGASSVEYNGHFGRNIFFTVESAKELPRVLKSIERIVSK